MSRARSSTQQALPSIRDVLPEQFTSQHLHTAGISAQDGVRAIEHHNVAHNISAQHDCAERHDVSSHSDLEGRHHLSQNAGSYECHHAITPLDRERNIPQEAGPLFAILRPRSFTDPTSYTSNSPAPSPYTGIISDPRGHHHEVVYGESTRWVTFGSSSRALGDRKHECPHCFKCFNRPSSLAIHINSHTGAKPFICPICSRPFSVNSNMRRHYRNHGSKHALPGVPLEAVSFSDHPSTNSPFSTLPLPPFPSSVSPRRLNHAPHSGHSDSDSDGRSESGSDNSYAHSGGDIEEADAALASFKLSSSRPNTSARDHAARGGSGNSRSSFCNVQGCDCGQPVSTVLRPAVYDEDGACGQ
ncbi:hypothetical protein B0H21DRAFT_729769 [Amylocystis lapponica]|nr:hypothetical protein B0H21DRAFT_729769 [Amylocystis lapponica]